MGRKKVQAKMKAGGKLDIRLRVDVELHGRIQAVADREGNSVAAFIRSAVVKELKRRDKEDAE
jgi:predicted HicB family RNase H-like nuclease